MKFKKLAIVAVSAVAAAGLLAGCGGDKNAKFCDLASDNSALSSVGSGDASDSDAILKQLKDIQAAAPDELKSDIKTVVDAYEQIKDLDMTDPEQLQAFTENVDQEKLLAASENVQTKMQEICKK